MHDAELLIGLVITLFRPSPSYVMFELGARWGPGKPMIQSCLHSGAFTPSLRVVR